MNSTIVKSESITEMKRLVLDIESLELFGICFELDSDQKIQLRESKENLFNLIKTL
jgi:hypothetical protein